MTALLAGRFDEIPNLAEIFRKTGNRARDTNAIHAHATQIAICKFETGQPDEVLPVLRTLVDEFPTVAGWRCALAFLLAESGQFDETRIELERLATFDFEDFRDRETDSISLNLLASTAAQLDDKTKCEILYERLLPAEELHTVIAYAVAYFGPVSDRLGQLAAVAHEWEIAFQHFDRAVQSCERVGSYPWLAHVQAHYAEALITRGNAADQTRIRNLITRSYKTANRLSMKHLTRRIDRIRR
jgi:tetratricopeptide (TPR) repeat protein